MCKKLIFLFSFVLVLGLVMTNVAKGVDPDLLLWWKFDETSGTTASDSSGNGRDGTLNGDPKWVPGQINGALDFGGDGDHVINTAAGSAMNGLSALTVALWVKSDVTGTDSGFIIFEAPGGTDDRDIRYDQDGGEGDINLIKYGITSTGGNPEDESSANTQTTDWQHIAVVWSSGNQQELYINGVLDIPTEIAGAVTGTLTGYDRVMVGKGGKDEGATEGWDGLVDDVRIYSRVLTEEEIQVVMIGIPPGSASNPSPANEATDVPREVVLSWTPGDFAPAVNGHIVYLSENFDDVNDGIGGIAQDANSYTPPQRLDFGTTYYWRIDEVNNVNPDSPWISDVWSFTTEPVGYAIENLTVTASSAHQVDMGPENTINGSGLDENDIHSMEPTDMWLSSVEPLGAWIEYEFDKVYKLHEMWVWNSNQTIESLVGFGLKDVTIDYSTNGTDYTTLDTTHEFAQAPGT
ncbi:MAG: LamG domain-containing protein, partial [Planctomycetota bacterium]